MNKRRSIALIAIVTFIVITFLVLVSGSNEADSNKNDNRITAINDNYSTSADNTVNGTHILTDGCRDTQKTKRHLLEEAISAFFDGDFSEAGKKLTFLYIFSLDACHGYTEVPAVPVMADNIEIELDTDIQLEPVILPPIAISTEADNTFMFDNHLYNFPLTSTTWADTYKLNRNIPIRGYQAFYMHSDNPSQVIEKGDVATVAKKYSWSDFKGIPSQKFMAYWVGSLIVPEAGFYQVLISKSHSKARVSIDKRIIIDNDNDNGSDEVQKVYMPAGNYVVEVEYLNGWHTTDVAMDISPIANVKQLEDPNQFLSKIKQQYPDVVALYAGAYEADNQAIVLDIPAISKPVILYLSSYEDIKWQINNTRNANIVGVIYGGYGKGSQVQGLTQQTTVINSGIYSLGYKNNTVCHCNRDSYQCMLKGNELAGSVGTGNPYEKYGIDIIQFVGSYSTDYLTFAPYNDQSKGCSV